MKFISWNVNGLRACLKKGFEDTFNALDADFFCVQETKMQPGQADFAPAGYTEYIYSAEKKGGHLGQDSGIVGQLWHRLRSPQP